MTKIYKHQDYAEDIIYQKKKSTDIRYVINTNHEKICKLLNNKAKKFLEVDWLRYQLQRSRTFRGLCPPHRQNRQSQ